MMNDEKLLKRITVDSKILTGKPVIKGTRLSVEFILGLLAHGATEVEILNEYQHIEAEDIKACLLFANKSLSDTSFVPLTKQA